MESDLLLQQTSHVAAGCSPVQHAGKTDHTRKMRQISYLLELSALPAHPRSRSCHGALIDRRLACRLPWPRLRLPGGTSWQVVASTFTADDCHVRWYHVRTTAGTVTSKAFSKGDSAHVTTRFDDVARSVPLS
ncbi:hypothetical protein BaRGS_00015584 [Batillaria attramentaria]|uniref:Uncharacterized protein n=1 Tax=Batillaria attramentaria TaxID=370345 RepID=A0ABD0L1F9_9CAEN